MVGHHPTTFRSRMVRRRRHVWHRQQQQQEKTIAGFAGLQDTANLKGAAVLPSILQILQSSFLLLLLLLPLPLLLLLSLDLPHAPTSGTRLHLPACPFTAEGPVAEVGRLLG